MREKPPINHQLAELIRGTHPPLGVDDHQLAAGAVARVDAQDDASRPGRWRSSARRFDEKTFVACISASSVIRRRQLAHLMTEAISGNPRPSEVIRGHQRPSEAIRGHQGPSGAIRGHQ